MERKKLIFKMALGALLLALIASTGEKTVINRFARFSIGS